MRRKAPNVRFWVWENDCEVRLTLRPGQNLTHLTGGPDEEGFNYTETTWAHCYDHVTVETDGVSTDCDGRMTTHSECRCELNKLSVKIPFVQEGELIKGIQFPMWKLVERSQRDFSAEVMGY